jgi:rfaE bifunctional protein nucleotidyltransferase chain/domain
MNIEENILTLEEAISWRNILKEKGETLVVTNGCFDILHRGHASYLKDAATYGDHLLILVNSDAAVRQLKGPTRPVVNQEDRCYLLACLKFVSKVVIFNSPRCDKELAALAPDVYTKAGDYTLETLDKSELAAMQQHNTKIVFMPFVAGKSTTSIVEKCQAK